MGACREPRVGRECTLTCVKTGEKRKFGNLHAADRFLGYAQGFINQKKAKGIDMFLRREDQLYWTIEYGEVKRLYPVNGVKAIPIEKFKYKAQQLCWTCKKCYGGCNWSDSFKPVTGWTATPTILKNSGVSGHEDIQSYQIIACPEYEE